MTAALLLLFAEVAEVVETPHYTLHAECEPALAQEYGRVLEAAHVEFAKFFGAKPKVRRGKKLVVRFFATREAWAKAILADRAVPPADAGGYYWPASKTAYLYRQPTKLYTRTLLIHEAAHQFHYLARTKNNKPSSTWYTEGIAEYLAAHTWDGETLTLGVLPHVTLKDYAAGALTELERTGFKLDAAIGAADTSRPLGWAIVRFAATNGFKRFSTWTRKMDSGGSATSVFKRHIGKGKKIQAQFATWLRQNQEPFRQVYNEWQSAGPRAIRGFSGAVSTCQLKNDVSELTLRFTPPKEGRWRAGVLLDHQSDGDYTIALLNQQHSLQVDRRTGKRWQDVARSRHPDSAQQGSYRMRVYRKGDGVFLDFAGKTLGPWKVKGSRFGLALDNCDITFREVTWK